MWTEIEGFPNYLISDNGEVYNKRTDSLMARSKTLQGDLKVTMVNGGIRITKSVRVLVAEAYVEKPHSLESELNRDDYESLFNTVIVLDNNKNNVSSYNLAWRPAWFAQKYSRQFQVYYPNYFYSKRVVNATTGELYTSVIQTATKEGLLFEDVIRSTNSGVKIFPTGCVYVFV